MYHGAPGAARGIGSRRVSFDLTGPVAIAPRMLVATRVGRPTAAASPRELHTRRHVGATAECGDGLLRLTASGGSGEVV